jgi:flagellar hook-associated protein 2
MATPGVITVGGLATGLDTNSIISQLVALERQPLDLLQQQVTDTQATQTSVGTVGTKLAAIQSAADALTSVSGVLVRKATSSDETVATAAAGQGAAPGSVTLAVSQLARASTASATTGVNATTATIADTSGTFKFQVGGGAVQTVNVSATTTLQDLVDSINGLGAGVTASAVNLGTSSSPDYRLQLVSDHTGAASSIAVVRDDTRLAVQTTQSGQDAHFTVAGFSGTFARDTNSFSDVLTGVTISLKAQGTATVTVDTDTDAVVNQVKTLVTAFNDLETFVDGESTVQENQDKSAVTVGSLATDTTIRRVLSRLHDIFSEPLAGATTQYVNLSSLGLATQKDGTIALDETKLRAALGDDPTAVAQVLAGNGTAAGIANDLSSYIEQETGPSGTLATHTQGLTDQIKSLQDEIDAGQRQLDQYQADLQAQFAALESLVSTLQSQGNFLLSAFGGGSSSTSSSTK